MYLFLTQLKILIMGLEFIKEGHYVDGNNVYKSLWIYKKERGISDNSNSTNYQEATQIQCSDKHWMPFNQSEHFRAGWHYNKSCLEEFYNWIFRS